MKNQCFAVALSLCLFAVWPAAAVDVGAAVSAIGSEAGLQVPADLASAAAPAPMAQHVATAPAAPLTAASLAGAKTRSANGPLKSPTAGPSRFDTLRDLYEHGTLPTEQDLTGWRAGRCYLTEAPNEAQGELLIGQRLPSDPNEGPLFSKSTFRILALQSLRDATYFDRMTRGKVAEISPTIDFTTTSQAQTVERSLASRYEEGNLEYRVRKSGEFLIEDDVVLRDESPYKAGESAEFCYFFQKVRD